MDQLPQPQAPLSTQPAPGADTGSTAKVVYILYLASIIFGVTSLVGVIMAYVNKAQAPEWLQSHYRYQIRTFWIGMLYGFIGALLCLVVIGFFVLLFVAVWLIVRCVKGMMVLDKQQPVANTGTWFW
jgi:uncharacterized membrane protein